MTLLDTARQTVTKRNMLDKHEKVLCAVSGGADSVALLLCLCELGYEVSVCHLHHGLRGEEADRDAAFVRTLCEREGVPFLYGKRDVAVYAKTHGLSVETAAREVRYAFFEEAAHGFDVHKIATAHTADDNLETILFHLIRGTGTRGMVGIPPVRDCYIRPLIEATREQVESFLAERGQKFVTDSTNICVDYTRNRLRHEVLPVLRGLNPSVARTASRFARIAERDNDYLDDLARQELREGEISCDRLTKLHDAVSTRVLRFWLEKNGIPLGHVTGAHFDALLALCHSYNPSARLDLPGACIGREYDRLVLLSPRDSLSEIQLIIPFQDVIWDNRVKLTAKIINSGEVFHKSFNTFIVNCDTIDFKTFTVRTRREGDCLSSTGGHKSLKKMMIDKKVPRQLREHLAVFADKKGVIAVEGLGTSLDRLSQGSQKLILAIEEIQ